LLGHETRSWAKPRRIWIGFRIQPTLNFVTIAGTAFPVSGSLIGGIVAAVLAAWMIFAGRKA
jgi:hypothetical protein